LTKVKTGIRKLKMISKVAIVHDYLFQYGGAEKVVEAWLKMYPEADIYTSFYTHDKFGGSKGIQQAYQQGRIKTTWLQAWFGQQEEQKAKPLLKYFKHFFWLYPLVMSRLAVKNYDLVLISSTYCGKNVRYKNCHKIVHYCHSPTRFLHGLTTEVDHQSLGKVYQAIIPLFKFWLRWLDLRAVKYLNKIGTIWLANSKYIQKTIKQVYNTKSEVVYPPVEVEKFAGVVRNPDLENPFYYYFGRISFHKRLDLLISTCLATNRRLVITGEAGYQKEMQDLKKLANNSSLITFTGRQPDEVVKGYLTRCKGFLFAGKEDFGIAPIEVLGAGVPAVMYGAGGALEYIEDGVNGMLFDQQNVESVGKTLDKFEKVQNWDSDVIKASASRYSVQKFEENIGKYAGR
jgi:glycosyltransferase involved in cell wall biosynthesis